MLLKNGERLTAEEISALKKKLIGNYTSGRFPITLTYTEAQRVWNPDNNKYDQPESITLPARYTINTNKGIEEWRYVENVHHDNNGREIMSPVDLPPFRGMANYPENKIELLLFKLNSPFCQNGPNSGQIRNHKFMIENKVKEARSYADKKRDEAQVYEKLFGTSSLAYKGKELETIAKALGIPQAEVMDDDEKRHGIDMIIQNKGEDGPAWFIEFVSDTGLIDIKKLIQEAIDLGLICTHVSRAKGPKAGEKSWRWKGKEGGPAGAKICNITHADDNESILAEVTRSRKLQIDLEKRVEDAKKEEQPDE